MENVIAGQATAAQLSAHRRAIMDLLVGHPLITTAEYDTAMQRTLVCQDVATLQKWYRNTVRELARREEGEPVTAPTAYATAQQVAELHRLVQHATVSRAERTRLLRRLPQLTEPEAAAHIRGLKLRQGPRLRVPVQAAGLTEVVIAKRHYEAAKVDYVQEVGTGRVVPRYHSLCGGPLVRRVWAN